MMRPKVIVTGASGFIGRHSVPPLIAAGYDVHAIVSPRSAQGIPTELTGAAVHRVDLLDGASADELMNAVRPGHLLHFAWIAAPGEYWTSPDNERWLAASIGLLRSFQVVGGRRAVVAGTCAEYDWSRVAVCNEQSSPLVDIGTPDLPYVRCKIVLGQFLREFAERHGMSTAWGRIFFQFGPGEHPHRLVSSVIGHLLSGREARCSHGRQIRTFLHVADVGAAFGSLLDSEIRGPVNIGSDNRLSIAELLDEIAGQIGRRDLLRLGTRDSPPFEPAVLVPDITRLRDELRWRPQYNLRSAVADTIDWWRKNL